MALEEVDPSNIANPTLNSITIAGSTFTHSVTPATKANLEPSATVKFVLMPLNEVVTLACPLKVTISELREQFASELKVEPQYLVFIHSSSKTESRKFFLFL